jgi:uncharacterized protein YbjQ (UPF0145 family)
MTNMLITTTHFVEGYRIMRYLGVVTGEVIIGVNIFRDFFARIRDIFGGRSRSYEAALREARETALREMAEAARRLGGNAVIGVYITYTSVHMGGSNMMMVTASGTAVLL